MGKVRDTRLHCSQCVPENVGGFGSLSMTAGGSAVVSQHMNEDGCARRGDMYLEDGPAAATWRGYLTPIPGASDPPYLEFPQAVSNPLGSFTLTAESPRTGTYDEVEAFRVSYLGASGTNFVCPSAGSSVRGNRSTIRRCSRMGVRRSHRSPSRARAGSGSPSGISAATSTSSSRAMGRSTPAPSPRGT
jgi:hypothetical protein